RSSDLDYKVNVLTRNNIIKGKIASSPVLKSFLVRERGNCCEKCGQGPEWNDKPLSLQLDHVDGNPDNNFPENIRLLCPNCHSQTETFSKGHGGPSKRNDYRQNRRKAVAGNR